MLTFSLFKILLSSLDDLGKLNVVTKKDKGILWKGPPKVINDKGKSHYRDNEGSNLVKSTIDDNIFLISCSIKSETIGRIRDFGKARTSPRKRIMPRV